MKPRENGFLKPDGMPPEVFDYIVELHEYLWRFCRAASPGAGGELDRVIDHCLFLAEGRRPEVVPHEDEEARKAGEQAAREAFGNFGEMLQKAKDARPVGVEEFRRSLDEEHAWKPDGGVLRFESHPGGEAPHVHTTCAKCGARAWFLEFQWELLSKGCAEAGVSPLLPKEPA